jgi:DNA invertase Pin-like site-specific DNA recombinase
MVNPEDACAVCELDNGADDNLLLLCDNCDEGSHPSCVGVTNIPDGNWYCPDCLHDILTDSCATDQVHLYSRVSSVGQDNVPNGRIGLDVQTNRLNKYVMNEDLTVVEAHVEVGSARNPQKLKILNEDLVKNLQCGDCVLVYSISRIARNRSAGKKFVQRLHNMGVTIYAVDEGLHSYSVKYGTINKRFLQGFDVAQQESDQLSRRMKDVAANIVAQGGHLGPAPFGYEIYRDETSGVRKIRPNENEQRVIRRMQTAYNTLGTYVATAQLLNGTRKCLNRGNAHWTSEQVSRILGRVG